MILKKQENNEIEFFQLKKSGKKYYVEFHENIKNGFPSPAEDFSGTRISLDEKFLSKPESTYIGRAKGMSNYPFIMPGDFLVIRADLDSKHGDLAIVYITGEGFTAKKINLKNSTLESLNKEFPIIEIKEDELVETRGVVTAIFRDIKNLKF